ncbi:SAM-dependent methyltransferase [Microbispora sp. CA-135349]|uniref:SAM-dependent methyltransferase n=1 Tax=Microbispora sp. CA-135349 TaxID=3239953 RepID=UPI003D8EB6F2
MTICREARTTSRPTAKRPSNCSGGRPARVRCARRPCLPTTVRHLAKSGRSHFLDIGTGIPTQSNLHEIAQEVDPDARVVYVDKDPIILAHGRLC